MVKRLLKILMIEDVPKDALLINAELRRAGFEFESKRVETREDFLHELDKAPPDLILSDHGLPSFDGFTALALAKKRIPEVPFIFVTGALGEEITIRTFEQGATDYVLKQNLQTHLCPAVERAFRESEERRRRKVAESQRVRLIKDLQEALIKMRKLKRLIPICSGCKRIRNEQGYWQGLEQYFQEHLDISFTHGICPDCGEKLYPEFFHKH